MATRVKVKDKEVAIKRLDQEPENETIVEVLDLNGAVAETHRLANGGDITLVIMETHSITIREAERA